MNKTLIKWFIKYRRTMILAISTVVFAVSLCQKYNITINNLLLATGGGPWSW